MAAWLEARGVESKQDATTAKIESDPSATGKDDEEDAQGNGEGEVQPCRKGCPWSKGKGKGKAWWAMAGHGGKPWQHDGFPYPWWMHVAPWHYGMDASVWDSFSDAFDDSASATVWIDADDGAVENP